MQILYSKHHLISCIASNLGIAISFRSTRRFLTCSSAAQLRNVQLVQTPKIRRYQVQNLTCHRNKRLSANLKLFRALTSQTISNSNQPSVVDGPVAVYEQLIRTRKLNNDPFQRKIIGILQGLYDRVLSFYPQWNEIRHKESEGSRNRGLSQSGWLNKVWILIILFSASGFRYFGNFCLELGFWYKRLTGVVAYCYLVLGFYIDIFKNFRFCQNLVIRRNRNLDRKDCIYMAM